MIQLENSITKTNKEKNFIEDVKKVNLFSKLIQEIEDNRGFFAYSNSERLVENWGRMSIKNQEELEDVVLQGNKSNIVFYYDVYDRTFVPRAIYNKTAFRIELDIKELGYNKDKELSVALSELTTYKCDDILKEYFESVFNQEKYRKWEPWFLLEDIYNNNWIQKYNYLLKNKYKKSDFYFSESDKKLISKMFSSEIMKEKEMSSDIEKLISLVSKEEKVNIILNSSLKLIEDDVKNNNYNLFEEHLPYFVSTMVKFRVSSDKNVQKKYYSILEDIISNKKEQFYNFAIKLDDGSYTNRGIPVSNLKINKYSCIVNDFYKNNLENMNNSVQDSFIANNILEKTDNIIINNLYQFIDLLFDSTKNNNILNRFLSRKEKLLLPTSIWNVALMQIKVFEAMDKSSKTSKYSKAIELFNNNFIEYNGEIPDELSRTPLSILF